MEIGLVVMPSADAERKAPKSAFFYGAAHRTNSGIVSGEGLIGSSFVHIQFLTNRGSITSLCACRFMGFFCLALNTHFLT